MTSRPDEELTVTIPTPNYIPSQRGWFSTTAPASANVKVRLSPIDRERIIRVATERGMTMGAFIRYCATHVAQELEKREQWNTTSSNSPPSNSAVTPSEDS